MQKQHKKPNVERCIGLLALSAAMLLMAGCGKSAVQPAAEASHVQTQTLRAEAPKAAPQAPPAPKIISIAPRSWTIPKQDGVNDLDREITELTINATGTRVLARSKKSIYLFDLTTGSILRTIKPSANLRNPTTDRMFLSPTAGVLALYANPLQKVRDAEATMTFEDAASGAVISTARLQRNAQIDFDTAVFTPQGTALLLPCRYQNKLCVELLSVMDGTSKMLNLPLAEKQNGRPRIFLPVPGSPAFVVCWNNDRIPGKHFSQVSVLDIQNGTERPEASVDLETFQLFHDRWAAVSADGGFVLVQNTGQHLIGDFEVSDLRTDTLVLHQTGHDINYPAGCFTPDAKRCLVEWAPHFYISHFGNAPDSNYKEQPPCTFQLYDLANKQKLAEYALPTAARMLVLSAGGNTIAWSHRTQIYAVDFRSAFGIEPLTPLAPATDTVFAAR